MLKIEIMLPITRATSINSEKNSLSNGESNGT